MKKRHSIWIFLITLFAFSTALLGQVLPGSGNAFRPNALSHIRVPDFFPTAYPFTINAWIQVPDANRSMTIISTDGTPLGYNGVWLQVDAGMQLSINAGHAGTSRCFTQHCRNSLYAQIPFEYADQWIHVSATMTSATAGQMVINGEVVPHTTGGRGNGTITNRPQPNAIIGAFYGHTPNNDEIHNKFMGGMDEISVWNRALTLPEIRKYMCQSIHGSPTGLVAYFKFDEMHDSQPLIDYAPLGLSGNHVGQANPRWPSGAYIGDTSTYYHGNPGLVGAPPFFHTDLDGDTLRLDNAAGSFSGVHVYSVYSDPLQKAGLDTSCIPEKYFGIFLSDTWSAGMPAACEFRANVRDTIYTEFKQRTSNSAPIWIPGNTGNINNNGQIWSIPNSQEMIRSCDTSTIVDPDPVDPDTNQIPTVPDDPFSIQIPNVFSPNGDGVNDLFAVDVRGIRQYHIQIFNRWGQLLFESDDADLHWNGSWNGRPVAAGAYMAIIKASPLNGEVKEFKEVVHLVR
jgi:gliding motility-associated-like protein